MRKTTFRCEHCGEEFEIELITAEEAHEKKIQMVPVCCPKCNSTEVREAKKYY